MGTCKGKSWAHAGKVMGAHRESHGHIQGKSWAHREKVMGTSSENHGHMEGNEGNVGKRKSKAFVGVYELLCQDMCIDA